jgi:hypothetical protein
MFSMNSQSGCKICNEKKKIKYLLSLVDPENQISSKIPTNYNVPTIKFKRRRQMKFQTNSLGLIQVQWCPQPLFITTNGNSGIFVFNGNTYDGNEIQISSTSYGFGQDLSGALPSGTPIRLVSASMKICYPGGISNYQGTFVGASYESPLSTLVPDTSMNIFANVNSLSTVKLNKGDGIKIIYCPAGPDYKKFYQVDFDLGRDGTIGNGIIEPQRFVFYATDLPPNSLSVQIIFTQVFEAVVSSDFFSPAPFYCNVNINQGIKNYITDRKYNVMTTQDELMVVSELTSQTPKEECNNCNINNNICIFDPSNIRDFRLPTMFGELTSTLYQKRSATFTTNSNGCFAIKWQPQFYHTSGNSSQTGFYFVNNNTFDGHSNAVVTQNTSLDFSNTIPFTRIRLVTATMKVRFYGISEQLSGQFIIGKMQEIPDLILPSANNFSYNVVNKMNCKLSTDSFNGLKYVYTPSDEAFLNFYPTDILQTYNNIPTVCDSIYLVGYGLPTTTTCIQIMFERMFEGHSISEYVDLDVSSTNIETCKNLYNEIVENDLIFTKLCDENSIKLKLSI